ncbi:hypothetical protein Acid345_2338 [Candidatus Koribacter versatilis Ellin345]|uniref:Uncharacterized protein n=1 Tax=Koribacter versatilis (strain Ellin345) TaxID=204669 RepID=Q1IP61_KORVE|nr:hypothetical protein [Candidatus Koribacter versatilis]ABF41339.1 hypothetical protein Acid345_2338 [Candidatus Koribacter versatilis Ellin345]
MKRMIELIKSSAIPANMMRSAAKGALSVAPGEMIEILVYLAGHPVFGKEASLTLAGWSEKDAKLVLADPKCSPDVLNYFMDAGNFRLPLLNALLANPSVTEDMMVRLAMQASTRVLANMLWHPRVLGNISTLHAISMNISLPEEDAIVVRSALANLGENTDYLIEQAQLDVDPDEPVFAEDILNGELQRYTSEHADEIAAEEGKAFEIYVDSPAPVQEDAIANPAGGVISGAGAVPSLINTATAAQKPEVVQGKPDPSIRKKVSAFQKIARLGVGERVQLAMKGSKDERFILIRDGSKVVSAAVLESPKLTDQEAELFASLKNVQESVLRGISSKRKFMRSYLVQRNLCTNPRCPLDISLPLVKGLMINDLRGMSTNKNVNDTIRKMALKLYKQRAEKKQE